MRARLAVVLWSVAIGLAGLAWALPAVFGSPAGVGGYEYWREATVATPLFATVGAVIAARRPEHRIGWLFLAIGVTGGVQFATGEYAGLGPSPARGAPLAWLVSTSAQTLLVTLLLFLVLLFPTGRLPSQRWRPVAWCLAVGPGLGLLIPVLTPGPLADFPGLENPLGVPALVDALRWLQVVSAALGVVGVPGALTALVVRLHRSRGVERQQLKLFVYAAVAGVVGLFGVGLLFPEFGGGVVSNVLWTAVPCSLAVAAAAAILRHGLYDIDRVISRTVAYAAVTAALGVLYVGGVLVLRQLFAPLASESQLAVAGSTLAVAAAFGPVRRRVQAAVDRRFHRARYDAQQTVVAFSARLRDEVDLDGLRDDLLAVVGRTFEPTGASLWLRQRPLEVRDASGTATGAG